MRLEGRRILITGASAGIGKALAERLSARGAHLALVSNQPVELFELARTLNAFPLEVDLSAPDRLPGLVSEVEAAIGPLDVLINNAGIGLHAPLLDTPPDRIRRLFEVNFFAPVELCRQALASMAARRSGHILNVTSASARRGLARMGAYAPSKGALHVFSQVLRLEAARVGVHVTEVLPISVQTDFFRMAENRTDHAYRPRGLVHTPEQVAACIEQALRRPRAEVYPSFLSRLAFVFETAFPNLTAWLLDVSSRRESPG